MKLKKWYVSQGAGSVRKRIAKRVEELESLLANEPWLPFSLRGLLATELPQILKTVRSGRMTWRKRVSKQLLVASLASWVYGPSPLESKTIAGIQALELEINGSVSLERKNEPSEGDDLGETHASL
ncbi:hypothetical protein [Pelagicoccus sp. SDUM812002]|uniref:hypothetical protein n=1 Tax=Pelagicoccus sp. SDUM812002 TaxID=3041266 RepID=UPI00280C5244|nr:hypothetical protein [Pelagicoccus sp. SDUM812002]MDQ8184625.1 hypothetical protein [Pelagicoccus sp. SDUM812002]